MKTLIGFYFAFLGFITTQAQSIVDPCFASVPFVEFFEGSDEIKNLCTCAGDKFGGDIIEWDDKLKQWNGPLPKTYVNLPPPDGCNIRAIWLGAADWSIGGEGFAMRLDKPLEPGKKYTFTFTYASNGFLSDHAFSPVVYTDKDVPDLHRAYNVGRLPSTDGWVTNSYTFTVTEMQKDHNWLILRAIESSGIILSNCHLEPPLLEDPPKQDSTCLGDSVKLQAIPGKYYNYNWSTGEETSSISVKSPGEYKVEVRYLTCTSSDSATLYFKDCETRLTMPNVFTPNGIEPNELFVPMEYNYVESGQIHIINRWGLRIFTGDLFTGWNGKEQGNKEAPMGTYYYEINYNNKKGRVYYKKGWVTLLR